ncbi:MAG: YncE family protein [Flavobacteriales bacterium]|nr:YncE family protein [Flavobacteriales bacterium]MCC6939791.1 YncE family protein [Flavobacteriales bacterium]
MTTHLFSSLMAVCAIGLATSHAQDQPYRVAHRFNVPGDGRWDLLAVDEATSRIFLSHGTETNIVDERTGELLGTVPDTKGVHGVAIAPGMKKGYISCGKDSSVVVFDLDTYKVLGHVQATGGSPDAIVFEPFSNRVVVFNAHGSNATVIDPRTDAVVTTIALEGKPELCASDGAGHLYVNLEDKSSICVISTATWNVESCWPIAPGEGPSGLALDNATHRLFAVCENKMMVVVDAVSGKVITTLPIGERVDGAAFDPGNKRVYASNGEGSLTVVQQDAADAYHVLATLPTQKGAKTLALDTRTHHVLLPTAEFSPAPEPTKDDPKPRPSVKPGTFVVLDVEPVK